MMRILIIDGQGGGIGRQLVAAVKKAMPSAHILAVGTNGAATGAMMKAGADQGATGENAVLVGCRKADVIAGPLGIVVADSMLGEITPSIAVAVGQSDAVKILLPISQCNNLVAGVQDFTISRLIQDAVELLQNNC